MQAKRAAESVRRLIWPLAALVGILLMLVVFVTSTNADMAEAQQHLSDTVNYIRKQCATYSSLNLASETKSLLRIAESVQQVDRDIRHERALYGSEPDEEALARYADNLYLTEVLLLDEDGTVRTHYCSDGFEPAEIADELKKTAVLDTAQHPEKTYAARLDCSDGSYVDMAVIGRSDGQGLIAACYHTPAAYVESYSLSFQNLLSGYSIENDGTIVVASGDTVVASNNESLIGAKTDDIAALLHIREKAIDGRLVHVSNESGGPINQIFGVIDRGRDYYVYAYMAERSVFGGTPRKLLLAMIGYAFALLLLQIAGWKMERKYREEQIRREQDYQRQLMESARRAESANVAKTEFLQRMSHDIRTPINGIRGMVEIGNYYKEDAEKQAECRKKIWDASGLLLELVNEVLDMGKLESGEVVLEERPFHLPQLLDEICATVERSAAERGITIERRLQELPHPDLIGSPLHLKRLLMNLLSNAVKYNKDNGHITITCREVRCDTIGAWIEFICADTGIGMSKEFQEHLFEPFVQENNDARSTYGGTGLGMAITKSLVEKMGGTISFESERGVGTTYYVMLPFKVDETPGVQVREESDGSDISLAGMHLLVAEDNDLNMEIASFLLENAGATLTKAENGEQAVDLFSASQVGEYDAILMDVMMPVLDGYAATRAIRALDRSDAKSVPIIAMTANAFPEDRRKALDAGMNEHLTKPLEPAPLLKTLRRYLKRQ